MQANPAPYVIKPSGEAQNIKRLLFVGQEDDGKDIIHVLETYKKIHSETIKVFQLQRRMTGVEVAVGAFFNGKEFVYPININFEHKKLFPGQIGPSTGEMGTLTYWSPPNRLFNRTLKKLEPRLREEGYVGYIDLNCIVNHQGIYPLEFTSRFGYPTIFIQQESMITPAGEFLAGLAEGHRFEIKTRSGFQVGVRIVVPPYPFQDQQAFKAMSKDVLVLFKKPNYEGIHIEDVREVNGEWLITDANVLVAAVVAFAATGGTPAKSIVGKTTKLPPPATEFRAPPTAPAYPMSPVTPTRTVREASAAVASAIAWPRAPARPSASSGGRPFSSRRAPRSARPPACRRISSAPSSAPTARSCSSSSAR